MTEGLLFANAAVKTRESGLMNAEKLGRIIEADTLRDAVRVLAEAGYGGGSIPDDPNAFEDMLKAEEEAVESFVAKSAPKGSGFECLSAERDFHNLKALLKAEYYGVDPSEMILKGGSVSPETLKERLKAGSGLGEFMGSAVDEIRLAYAEKALTPRKIDCAADRAMFREIAAITAGKGVSPAIRKYFRMKADMTNVVTYARCVAVGGGYPFFAESFAEGGAISKDIFERAFRDGADAITLMRRVEDQSAADVDPTPSELEKYSDDALTRLISSAKADMFTVQPIMGYYLGKKTEIKMLRIALVCIKNGVPREEIKKKMRKLYA